MKADLRNLIRSHYGTYVIDRTGKPSWQDYGIFTGLPIALAVGCGVASVTLPEGTQIALLTVSSLLSVFLFGVMLQIADRAMGWADAKPERGARTARQATLLEELAANAGYASLTCVATAVAFVVVSVTKGDAQIVFSALSLGLALHMLLMLTLVMNRLFTLTQARLIDARTEGKVAEIAPSRRHTG
jgi:hypothetical protein